MLVAAAAAAAERLRVGTLVLDVPFWNPALPTREIATTDLLTGGRLEAGDAPSATTTGGARHGKMAGT
ncbi:LLM class flavin-dependent oxidoreductase [Catellatospora sp. NPDC049111]|uniref:LLM class flavin-dependent oxidoreductase n=1 Tax=Catellatospora sp. NPDC049111 TaxID=3155271 RepID=UPI00340A2993